MNRAFGLPGSGPVKRYEQREALGWLPRGWIDGLVISNDSTDATNDIAISAGVCRSTINVVEGAASTLTRDQLDIEIPVSTIKQLDVSWAPENYDPDGYSGGGRSGMLSPLSSISNTTWHIYAVGGGDCPDDIIAIDSVTQATVINAIAAAGGFTAYRRIGSIVRLSAAIALRTQVGDFVRFKTPVAQGVTVTTTRANGTFAGGVPSGLALRVQFSFCVGTTDSYVYISCPDDTDVTPTAAFASARSIAGNVTPGVMEVTTNTSAQFAHDASTGSTTNLDVVPLGYWDFRGRDA